MDYFQAWKTVFRAVRQSGDKEALAALQVLIRPPTPNPPGALGGLAGNATLLAQQIHKTGEQVDWSTLPMNSQAMERLIHRVTVLLESLLDVFEAGRLAEMAGQQNYKPDDLQAIINSPVVVDELYQPGYCDDCGTPLLPDGSCLNCEKVTSA